MNCDMLVLMCLNLLEATVKIVTILEVTGVGPDGGLRQLYDSPTFTSLVSFSSARYLNGKD